MQAGLFSAVTSAFIIEVNSQLQPDPNDETAALLRVLIYKIDNTTFGNEVPTLPQWTGPLHTVVQVQAILFASLAASLLSALLAMLGKQWLNRYVSTDMRGTAIERSQNRQHKLSGIVSWYFDYVMESLPLMLQIALLLLGGALSRYLWEINITIASVVIGVTSVGVIFYLFIVVAGTTSESCPYQTPGSQFLRYVLPHILCTLRLAPPFISILVSSKLPSIIRTSSVCDAQWWPVLDQPWYSADNVIWNVLSVLFGTLVLLPTLLVLDICLLGMAIYRLLVTIGRMVYHWSVATSPQMPVMDLQCILWMLQTSLDKAVHLSTLKHLGSLISMPTDLDPTLVTYCFDVFVGCINANGCEVVVVQGLEQLSTVSALCFFHTISQLSITDPASTILKDVTQRYNKVFLANSDFRGHQFSHTMNAIHKIFIRCADRRHFTWDDYKPPGDEHAIIAQALVKLAQFGYQRTQQTKVPRVILRFALYSLSLDPPPPTPVIVDCLSIIAVDLGCDILNAEAATLDERSVRTSGIVTTLTLNQRTSGAGFEPGDSETQNISRS